MPRTFTLLHRLGEGAFGHVHLAEVRDDDDFVQTLAVKQLHQRWSDDQELVSRLRDEARLLGLLHHDHIVRVYGLSRIEGRLAILMEPIQGVDLSQVDIVPPRALALIVAAVADALAAAYDAIPPGKEAPLRVVHRDIKPSNIMVTPRGSVKVMDFGVARATFDTREAQTRSQQFGTARYMAPERWLLGIADAPSDVYSLGVTLVELLRGRAIERPRLSPEAFAEDMEEALAAVSPPALQTLARAMTAFLPHERPVAAEVSRQARALAWELPGDDLVTWAAQAANKARPPGQATGTLVVEEALSDETRSTALWGPPIAIPLAAETVVVPTPAPAPVVRRGGPTTPSPRFDERAGWVLAALVVLSVFVTVPWLRRQEQVRQRPPAPVVASQLAEVTPEAAPVTAPSGSAPVEVPSPGPSPSPSTAPAPRPRPVAAVPTPAPVPSPEPQDVPRVAVTFVIEGPLAVNTPAGVANAPRKALMLPAHQTHRLTVDEGQGSWPCTIVVGGAPTTVTVRSHQAGGCSQR